MYNKKDCLKNQEKTENDVYLVCAVWLFSALDWGA